MKAQNEGCSDFTPNQEMQPYPVELSEQQQAEIEVKKLRTNAAEGKRKPTEVR